ncbi:hypothetical protein NI389_15980 [Pseudoalteromonas xiamenensis]|uniref:hypothetical protein n=1 Tax=Pseudoalteromonas xiamenensis TaxID=882626 RepID=UPI0027E4EFDD|nr:hypothetical protein [Pseudoalteromonas xiamenensis]WMN59657.1 hypothetical protein NI389_15980 [Pseudoalteromonas xiamenensis]
MNRILVTFVSLLTVFNAVNMLAHAAESQSNPQTSTPNKPSYYRDCSVMKFEDIDEAELTQAERILLKEQKLEASLNSSAECMDEAMQSNQQRLRESNSRSGESSSVSESHAKEQNEESRPEEMNSVSSQQKETNPTQTSNSKQHIKGKVSGGSSAVCDAIKQGLAQAKTDNEKQHFEKLAKEYRCE